MLFLTLLPWYILFRKSPYDYPDGPAYCDCLLRGTAGIYRRYRSHRAEGLSCMRALGIHLMVWSGSVGEAEVALLPEIKRMGYDGVEVPFFDPHSLDITGL